MVATIRATIYLVCQGFLVAARREGMNNELCFKILAIAKKKAILVLGMLALRLVLTIKI